MEVADAVVQIRPIGVGLTEIATGVVVVVKNVLISLINYILFAYMI